METQCLTDQEISDTIMQFCQRTNSAGSSESAQLTNLEESTECEVTMEWDPEIQGLAGPISSELNSCLDSTTADSSGLENQESSSPEEEYGKSKRTEVQNPGVKVQIEGNRTVTHSHKTKFEPFLPPHSTCLNLPKTITSQNASPTQKHLSISRIFQMASSGNQGTGVQAPAPSDQIDIPVDLLEKLIQTLAPDLDIAQTLASLIPATVPPTTKETEIAGHQTPPPTADEPTREGEAGAQAVHGTGGGEEAMAGMAEEIGRTEVEGEGEEPREADVNAEEMKRPAEAEERQAEEGKEREAANTPPQVEMDRGEFSKAEPSQGDHPKTPTPESEEGASKSPLEQEPQGFLQLQHRQPTPPPETSTAREDVPMLETRSPQQIAPQDEESAHDSAAERERLRERKRKGKLLAQPKKKKVKTGRQTTEESRRLVDSQREEVEAPVYRKSFIRVDGKTLRRATRFEDATTKKECDDRVARGRTIKSGKAMHLPSLIKLNAEEEFLQYIGGIGFEWLLEPKTHEVPIALAQEFFTTFEFQSTSNVNDKSIRFRLFGKTWRMSLTEWSVRLGLYTEQEAEAGLWLTRDMKQPKHIKEFDPQAAWEAITANAHQFKATASRATFIKDPPLRLAQVFLGYNLLGQGNTSASITMAELYFMWCMKEQRKVHLGYWIAYTCRMIAGHAVRNLNICHVLGEFLRRSLDITYEGIGTPPLCPSPEPFDTNFFVRTKILRVVGGRHLFYQVERADGANPSSPVLAIEDRPREEARLQEAKRKKRKETEAPGQSRDWDAWKISMETMMKQMVDNSRAQTEILEAQWANISLLVDQSKAQQGVIVSLDETLRLVRDHLINPSRLEEHSRRIVVHKTTQAEKPTPTRPSGPPTVTKEAAPEQSHVSSSQSKQRSGTPSTHQQVPPDSHKKRTHHHAPSASTPPPGRK